MGMETGEGLGAGGSAWTRWMGAQSSSTVSERSWFEGVSRMARKDEAEQARELAARGGGAFGKLMDLRRQLVAGARRTAAELAKEARLAPFRVALARARLEDSPEAWRLAMRACSQLALDSSLPMRKAGQLVFLAKIEPEAIGQDAARALVLPIQKEAVLRPEGLEGLFGYDSVDTTARIESLWFRFESVAMGLPRPGRQAPRDSKA